MSAAWLVPMFLAGTLRATNRGMRKVADLAPQYVALRGYPAGYLTSPVGDDQLVALDTDRAGGTLLLTLKLTATVLPGGSHRVFSWDRRYAEAVLAATAGLVVRATARPRHIDSHPVSRVR